MAVRIRTGDVCVSRTRLYYRIAMFYTSQGVLSSYYINHHFHCDFALLRLGFPCLKNTTKHLDAYSPAKGKDCRVCSVNIVTVVTLMFHHLKYNHLSRVTPLGAQQGLLGAQRLGKQMHTGIIAVIVVERDVITPKERILRSEKRAP